MKIFYDMWLWRKRLRANHFKCLTQITWSCTIPVLRCRDFMKEVKQKTKWRIVFEVQQFVRLMTIWGAKSACLCACNVCDCAWERSCVCLLVCVCVCMWVCPVFFFAYACKHACMNAWMSLCVCVYVCVCCRVFYGMCLCLCVCMLVRTIAGFSTSCQIILR
jgi:hypothetical protein